MSNGKWHDVSIDCLAKSLRQDLTIANKILDFFQLEVHKHVICSAVNGHSMFDHPVRDKADAAAFLVRVCQSFYIAKLGEEHLHLVKVRNPFYKKSLDEIKVMLDLVGDDKWKA